MVRKGKEPATGHAERAPVHDRTKWNYDNKLMFIETCTKAANAMASAGKVDRFDWTVIAKDFGERSGFNYSKDVMKNKYDSMRKDWILFNNLRKQTGVGWDPITRTIQASNEWWDSTIKKKKAAAKFRNFGLQFVDELDTLFTVSCVARGHTAYVPGRGFSQYSDRGADVDTPDSCTPTESTDSSTPARNTADPALADDIQADGGGTSAVGMQPGARGRKRSFPTSSKRKQKPKSRSSIDESVRSIAALASAVKDSYKSKTESATADVESDSFSKMHVMLEELDLPITEYIYACNLCIKDSFRKMLLTMPGSKRKAYIEHMYQCHQRGDSP